MFNAWLFKPKQTSAKVSPVVVFKVFCEKIFFRKKTFLFVVRSLRYSGYLTNTSCVCQVAGISKRSDNFYFLTPHVTNWIKFNSRRASARDYTVNEILWGFTKLKIPKILKISAFYLDKQKSFVPNATWDCCE